ncbi:MAG: cysteine synthase A [Alphaproteobacteria bacterium]|nr:cysteine synthase A [Alphaproteobacteria bacterium]
MIHDSILDTIGNTPLIRVPGLKTDADIILKLEFFNPLGSVKDRIGKAMLEDAEKRGALKKGMRIVEPTSGNTGIGLAFVAAAKGYAITLVMPESMSMERRSLLLLLGADVVLTPAAFGMRGAIAKAMEMVAADKNAIMMEQFDNPANPSIHEKTTAEEIWRDTEGKVDIVISGVGTGGSLSGIGKRLKAKKASLQMIAVEPEESPIISGGKHTPHKIQGIGAGFIPNTLDRSMIDAVEKVSSADSLAMARNLIKQHGIPVGISSGAAMSAALRIAAKPENKGKMIVVIIPSYTERYLSTVLAEEERTRASTLTVSEPQEDFLTQAGKRYGVG